MSKIKSSVTVDAPQLTPMQKVIIQDRPLEEPFITPDMMLLPFSMGAKLAGSLGAKGLTKLGGKEVLPYLKRLLNSIDDSQKRRIYKQMEEEMREAFTSKKVYPKKYPSNPDMLGQKLPQNNPASKLERIDFKDFMLRMLGE